MDWSFDFSRQADKFLKQQRIADVVVIEVVGRALKKLDGEAVAVDLERLTDPWKGYYRIRMQKAYTSLLSISETVSIVKDAERETT